MDGSKRSSSIGDDDQASFGGVAPGPYGLVVTGPKRFAALALYVTEQSSETSLPRPYRLPAISVENDLEIRNYAKHFPYPMPYYDYSDRMEFAQTTTRPHSFYRTRLGEDGHLHGRLYAVVSPNTDVNWLRTDVHVYQSGKVIHRVQPERSGEFVVPDLAPGIYDVVATSWLGYAAFRFEVLPQSSPSPTLVSTLMMQPLETTPDLLEILLLPRNMLPPIEETIEQVLEERAGNSQSQPMVRRVATPV